VALRLEDKKAIVDEVNVIAAGSVSAIAADYRGLTVGQMTELRKRARKADVYLRVVRNTLARRAVEGTRFDCIKDALTGPLVFAFAKDDPGAPARLMNDFAKDNDKLKVKVIAIDGSMIDAKRLADVAKLPTKDQAISQLMSVMKAPIQKFVGTLAAPHTKLVRVLVSVKDQKQASA
jgi:large subunit ribosomal protein L10